MFTGFTKIQCHHCFGVNRPITVSADMADIADRADMADRADRAVWADRADRAGKSEIMNHPLTH